MFEIGQQQTCVNKLCVIFIVIQKLKMLYEIDVNIKYIK